MKASRYGSSGGGRRWYNRESIVSSLAASDTWSEAMSHEVSLFSLDAFTSLAYGRIPGSVSRNTKVTKGVELTATHWLLPTARQ